jgi:hypothetical protein
MDAFNFAFSLFGLLLGFTLVEVLTGLTRTIKARDRLRIGWLTPLLAVFILLDLLSWWSNAWQLRDLLPVSYGTLLVGLVSTATYYYAASFIFPDDLAATADLDAHYWANRRMVLLPLLFISTAVFALEALVMKVPVPLFQAILIAAYSAAVLVAALSSRRWLNIAALVSLIANYLVWAMVA